jgi:hypothetical protein
MAGFLSISEADGGVCDEKFHREGSDRHVKAIIDVEFLNYMPALPPCGGP